jgi:hypothetical protein
MHLIGLPRWVGWRNPISWRSTYEENNKRDPPNLLMHLCNICFLELVVRSSGASLVLTWPSGLSAIISLVDCSIRSFVILSGGDSLVGHLISSWSAVCIVGRPVISCLSHLSVQFYCSYEVVVWLIDLPAFNCHKYWIVSVKKNPTGTYVCT